VRPLRGGATGKLRPLDNPVDLVLLILLCVVVVGGGGYALGAGLAGLSGVVVVAVALVREAWWRRRNGDRPRPAASPDKALFSELLRARRTKRGNDD
jgi:hypothetical protein